MTYRVDFTDQTNDPIIIQDSTVNTSTNLKLVGRNVSGYGEYVAENFIHILENFASAIPPTKPIEGQIWYNKAQSSALVYTSIGIWKPVTSNTVSTASPNVTGNEAEGDLWLDSTSKIIYVYNNGTWLEMVSIDPESTMVVKTRRDNIGGLHKTLEYVVNNRTTMILYSGNISWSPLSVGSAAERLANGTLMATEFPTIRQGSNLNTSEEFVFHGTATAARYADLAERYRSDDIYSSGTLVELGGLHEITDSKMELSENVFGVISTNPAFMMNSNAGEDNTHPYVALSGRVPCKTTGVVKKGDRMVSSNIQGVARAASDSESQDYRKVIGRALEGSSNINQIEIIEIVVGVK